VIYGTQAESWYESEHHDIEITMMLVSENSIQYRDAPSQPHAAAGAGRTAARALSLPG
jgi:hypothetical protein